MKRETSLMLVVAAFGAGLLLRFPPGQYGFYPRCPVYAWTGLLCPGCGGTRAVAALLRGHVGEALRWNALVASAVLLSLAGRVIYVVSAGLWPERVRRARVPQWQEPVGLGVLVVAVGFAVWRNLARV